MKTLALLLIILLVAPVRNYLDDELDKWENITRQ